MFCYVYNSWSGFYLSFICVIVCLLRGFYRCDVIHSLFETFNKALSSLK